MKNQSKIIISFLAVLLSLSNLIGQTKLGQTGFQFLSVNTDARATAMGNAYTTVTGKSSSLFYNPAGMADMSGLVDVSFSTMEWIANINYNALTLSFSPERGQYGVFGISVTTIDYGNDIHGTQVWGNNDGFIETGLIDANAIAIGFGYARSLTEKFSVGGQVKWVSQHLGESVIPGEGVKKNLADVLAFDFGTIFKTGFKSLAIGMSVRNFSEEIKFEKESLQLPLTFKIGVSANVNDYFEFLPESQSLLMSVDAVHPRSFDEYLNIGLEYTPIEMAALRFGYISAQDEQGVSFGAGLNWEGLGIDYSFTPFGVFDSVQRYSISYSY
ncbi:MAG: DUF3308 domain-containing protein [Calditrichaeota bacterium]|nr:MAG: DUF3308 domain-containing protein [Calditrichota bacterium]MBL1205412.1 DUF3308 domain-containing protein [Calditrichota bacterium]NOG45241.1 PorV/PorQ family protein [Calditrichota bacterium]